MTAGREQPGRRPRPGTSTFAPEPGSASLVEQVIAQAGMEIRLMLRNGEQLLLAGVIPLIVLVGGVTASDRVGIDFAGGAVNTLAPGVLALAVMSTSFTSLAIATGFERRYGVLKRLGASPLPRSGLLAGKVGAVFCVELMQVIVISLAAAALGWAPALTPLSVAGALLTVVLGTAAFASLGLLVAGVLRAEATLAAANLVYLLLLAGGAVILPASSYGGLGTVLRYLPSGALGGGMRASLVDGAFPATSLLVLAVWAGVGTYLTARTFQWE